MDLGLSGKRAIITGGSRGIGLAAADALAAEGAQVVLVSRSRADLDAAKARVARHGGTVLAMSADTKDDAAVRAMVADVARELGGVDILVNAAAEPGMPGSGARLASTTDDDLREQIETKVLGYLRAARAVAPLMIDQGWGRIISVSGLAARSATSLVGSVRNVAVAAMTKNLADELGPYGINVTVVHPGLTRTEKTAGMLAARASAQGVSEQEAEAQLIAGISVGRMITAQEIGDVIAFLASPRSVSITGDAVAVGGGARGPIFY
jgi:NAD(P)-dependent dehydrogenase (short-subunit alcohol dehydrogenase family)